MQSLNTSWESMTILSHGLIIVNGSYLHGGSWHVFSRLVRSSVTKWPSCNLDWPSGSVAKLTVTGLMPCCCVKWLSSVTHILGLSLVALTHAGCVALLLWLPSSHLLRNTWRKRSMKADSPLKTMAVPQKRCMKCNLMTQWLANVACKWNGLVCGLKLSPWLFCGCVCYTAVAGWPWLAVWPLPILVLALCAFEACRDTWWWWPSDVSG